MRLIVLGTGTEVGKTTVSLALARAMAEHGIPVQALKPVETGIASTDPSDSVRLAGTAFHVKHVQPHPLYGFTPPISPHRAARATAVEISLSTIVDWVAQHDPGPSGICIIETAGGAFSPLNEQQVNVDLARALQPAIPVLVAPNRLGVLHDVGATLAAMRGAGLPPDLLVLNQVPGHDASRESNAEELRRLHPQLAQFEHHTQLDPALFEWLLRRRAR